MYGVDYDFDAYFLKWGGAAIGDIMKQIALEQRRIFTVARQSDLESVFAGFFHDNKPFPEFPDPLKTYTWKTKEFGKTPLPSQLSVKEADVTSSYMKATDKGLEIGLPHLKPRRIDPLIKTDQGYAALSTLDSSYSGYLSGHERLMARSFKATIHMRKDVAKKLVAKHDTALERWKAACERERNPNFLKKVIAGTAFTLMGTGRRFDTFSMSEAYQEMIDPQRADGIVAWTDVQLTLDD
jgi:hypothetical protein